MKKQTTIKLNRQEVETLLRSVGITLPQYQDEWTLSFVRACDGAIEDCLSVTWEESYVPASSTFSLSVTAISKDVYDELLAMCKLNNRIAAVKHLRTVNRWTLKDSKDYIDHHFPGEYR